MEIQFVQGIGTLERVRKAMNGKEIICTKEISTLTGIRSNTIYKCLKRLFKLGEAEVVSYGGGGKDKYWRLVK